MESLADLVARMEAAYPRVIHKDGYGSRAETAAGYVRCKVVKFLGYQNGADYWQIHEAAADDNPDRVKNHDRRVKIAAAFATLRQASLMELIAATLTGNDQRVDKAADLAALVIEMQEYEPGTIAYGNANAEAVRTAKQLLAAISGKPAPQDR